MGNELVNEIKKVSEAVIARIIAEYNKFLEKGIEESELLELKSLKADAYEIRHDKRRSLSAAEENREKLSNIQTRVDLISTRLNEKVLKIMVSLRKDFMDLRDDIKDLYKKWRPDFIIYEKEDELKVLKTLYAELTNYINDLDYKDVVYIKEDYDKFNERYIDEQYRLEKIMISVPATFTPDIEDSDKEIEVEAVKESTEELKKKARRNGFLRGVPDVISS